MLRFISFGSGSSGNCYYFGTATDGLMIDIGVGIRTLKKHCKDYGIQLQSVKGIDNNYCIARKVADNMRRYVEVGQSFTVGEFHVRPFAVPHDASENVGYEIQVEGMTLVIMTDAGSVTDEMKETISRANYLIIEANHDVEMVESGPYPEFLKKRILSPSGHLSNKECGKVIAENMTENLRHVWLCHLSEENNHPELARKTVETILRSYGIVPGKDLELEVLRRQLPTGVYELSI